MIRPKWYWINAFLCGGLVIIGLVKAFQDRDYLYIYLALVQMMLGSWLFGVCLMQEAYFKSYMDVLHSFGRGYSKNSVAIGRESSATTEGDSNAKQEG